MTDKKFVDPRTLFASDKELESAGAWVPVGPYEFKIARAGGGNDAFMTLASKRFKPFQVAIENDTLPRQMADDMVIEVFAKTVVLDWRNVGDRDGNELPFTPQNCVELLTELPNLFHELQTQSRKLSNFRRENLEAAAKN